jgi:rhodanese-related sulfurtransferase
MSFELQNIVRNACVSLTAAAVLVFGSAAFAGDTPDSLKGAILVDAAKAKSLADSGVMVIDARVANEYAEAHIKGAISVPYKEKSAKAVDFDASQDSIDLSKLPSDKNKAVLIYCNGAECWKSYKASMAAIKAGYKTVYWFRLGIPEWKAKGYPTE